MTSVIKVDTIQNSSGTSALSIGADGNVSLGNPVAVEVRLSSPVDYTTANTFQLVPYNQIVNQSGNNFNTGTSVFTAPVDGWYLISAHVYVYSEQKVAVSIYKNGVGIAQFDNAQVDADRNPNGSSITHTVKLSANDEISIYVTANAIGTIYNNESNKTYLSIIKLA